MVENILDDDQDMEDMNLGRRAENEEKLLSVSIWGIPPYLGTIWHSSSLLECAGLLPNNAPAGNGQARHL